MFEHGDAYGDGLESVEPAEGQESPDDVTAVNEPAEQTQAGLVAAEDHNTHPIEEVADQAGGEPPADRVQTAEVEDRPIEGILNQQDVGVGAEGDVVVSDEE